jgi:hypothetical protein
MFLYIIPIRMDSQYTDLVWLKLKVLHHLHAYDC